MKTTSMKLKKEMSLAHAGGCAGLEGEDVVTFLRHDEKITSTKFYNLIQIFVNGCLVE